MFKSAIVNLVFFSAFSAHASQIMCSGYYSSLMGDGRELVAVSAVIEAPHAISRFTVAFKQSGDTDAIAQVTPADPRYRPRKYVGYNRYVMTGKAGNQYNLLLPQNVLQLPRFQAILQTNIDVGADNNDVGTGHMSCVQK